MMPQSVPKTGQPKRRVNWPKGMPQILALLLVLVVDSLVAPISTRSCSRRGDCSAARLIF